jgi:hypothetical protein
MEDPYRHLGTPMDNEDVCSLCADALPEDDAALVIWTDGCERMFVFCETCKGKVLRELHWNPNTNMRGGGV